MVINHLVAAQLSDGRVQLWASRDHTAGAWSLWKTDVDPDSSWTGWQQFAFDTPRTVVVGAGVLSNGAIQVFGLAAMPAWPVANVSMRKVSDDPNAQWAGTGLGFDGNCTDITAQQLSDGRLQIFALSQATMGGSSRLLSRWQLEPAWDAPLSAVADMNVGRGLSSIVALRLPDRRIQLIGGTNDGLLSTWKATTDPNAAWLPWTAFQSTPPVSSTTQLAWAPLPDGRPQVWSVNRFGDMHSTWKTTEDSNSAWVPWSTFEAPANVVAFAAEPLSDGRIQLWAADRDGAMYSTWKKSTDPNAEWLPWEPFPVP